MSEKRAQFKGKRNLFFEFDINKANFFLNAMIGPQTFKRLISNLLNNAIEAFNDGGQIKIGLFKNGSNILIKVQDNGKGIPKDVVTKIGERGFTFLKGKTEGGSGLGIYHAKTNLKRWNGSLQVESEEGRGTTITIEIPQSDPPSWFIGTLAVKTNSKVAILDDDPSIHEVWETRFKDLPKPFELLHFRRTDSFRDWQQNNRADLYLVDFELQGGATGLDLIQEYNLSQFAVLVTSKYEEPQVQAKCTQFRILMLPKLLASLVNIEYEIIS
jgi:anti-sigma regulatory factor (Ser/Thr protein kinase)